MSKNLKIFLPVFLFFISTVSFSQINKNIGAKRAPCFQKSLDLLGQKYVYMECDRTDNIINCNRKLQQLPEKGIVVNRKSGYPYTGDCETCYRNGIREHLVHFVNGKTDGIDTTFYKSGCPQVVRNFILGKENGMWTYYHDTSGLVAWRIHYKEGEKNGQSIFFKQHQVGTATVEVKVNNVVHKIKYPTYKNDTTKIEHYKNGLLDGVKKVFWPDSKIKREIQYKEGLYNGDYISYDTAGNILLESYYKLGKKDGTWKYYFDNGRLLRIENWEEGVKDGAFKTFYIKGFLKSLETYKNGKKDGKFMKRYPDNSLKVEATYRRDALEEKHEYDKYGNEIRSVGKEDPRYKKEDDQLPVDSK